MNKIRYLVFVLALILFPVHVLAAGDVTINKSSIVIDQGGKASFNITASNSAGRMIISSGNNSIVTVDKTNEWVENQTLTVNVTGVSPGNTSINISVNAATFDEEVINKTYTINVTVNAPKSSNNKLSSITIDGKSYGVSDVIDAGTTTNTTLNISATAEDSKATISGTGSKSVNWGNNNYTITVTAENGSKKNYTVKINRPDTRNSDNTLSSLSASPLELKFDKNTTNYSFKVEHNVTSINIKATPSNSKSSVTGTGNKNLSDYLNTFNVVVTAENGSQKTYVIKVIRKDAEGNLGTVSKDNTLKSLSIDGYEIDFKSDVLEYSIEVDNLVNSIEVKAETNSPEATYEVIGNKDLNVGNNSVKVQVTAENGDMKTYTINVNKKSDAPTTTIKELPNIIGSVSSNEVIVEIKDIDTVLSEQVLKTMKQSKKRFVINNYDNSLNNYSWIIDGSKIDNTNPIDTLIKFNSNNYENINNLTNYADAIYLNFEHSGAVPNDTRIRIYVGNKFKDGEKVNIYYYNESKNKMDDVELNIEVLDNYVEFELEHCSEFIITKAVLGSNSFNWLAIVSIIELVVIIGLIILDILKINPLYKMRLSNK